MSAPCLNTSLKGGRDMRSFDLTPLFRSTVGFDRLADMLDSVAQFDTGVSYPPYNIERTDENHYRISLAVAGFAEKDQNVEVRGAQLENGLLHIDLERIVPEEKKPRRIVINGKSEGRVIDAKVRAA